MNTSLSTDLGSLKCTPKDARHAHVIENIRMRGQGGLYVSFDWVIYLSNLPYPLCTENEGLSQDTIIDHRRIFHEL